MQATCLQSLMELGLSGLEAQAYVYLLQNSPSTGYGVAKGVGKPTANTYKAIASLYERGAVLREETGSREYRAVAPEELLGSLERRFIERKDRVASDLKQLGGEQPDDRVYGLTTPELVLERLRRMLAEARRCAILDLFPWSVDALAAEMEDAASRGVDVTVKAYQPVEIPGVTVVVDQEGGQVLERWPGQWANAVIDGKQYLLAWLSESGDAVHQAIFSGSPFLAWIYHTSIINEILCAVVESGLRDGKSSKEIAAAMRRFRELSHADDAPGYTELLKRSAAQ